MSRFVSSWQKPVSPQAPACLSLPKMAVSVLLAEWLNCAHLRQYLRRWCRHETVGSLVKMLSSEEKKFFFGSLSYRRWHRQLDLYDLTDVTLMPPFMEKGDGSHSYAIGNNMNSKDHIRELAWLSLSSKSAICDTLDPSFTHLLVASITFKGTDDAPLPTSLGSYKGQIKTWQLYNRTKAKYRHREKKHFYKTLLFNKLKTNTLDTNGFLNK